MINKPWINFECPGGIWGWCERKMGKENRDKIVFFKKAFQYVFQIPHPILVQSTNLIDMWNRKVQMDVRIYCV